MPNLQVHNYKVTPNVLPVDDDGDALHDVVKRTVVLQVEDQEVREFDVTDPGSMAEFHVEEDKQFTLVLRDIDNKNNASQSDPVQMTAEDSTPPDAPTFSIEYAGEEFIDVEEPEEEEPEA